MDGALAEAAKAAEPDQVQRQVQLDPLGEESGGKIEASQLLNSIQ